jgi:hypothetical protein
MKKALPADAMPWDTRHTKKPTTIISSLDLGKEDKSNNKGATSLKTQARNNARIIHEQNQYWFWNKAFCEGQELSL